MSAFTMWHWAFVSGTLCTIIYFFISLYKARSFFWRLQKQGMPLPPHHPIFGHLGLMMDVMLNLPRDIMPTVALGDQIRQRYPHLDRAFYLDMWPFTGPVLMIISPAILRQATQGETALPKVAFLKNYLKPLSGGHDLVSMEGDEWRRWRDVFRPAFSRSAELVPGIVDNICIFRDQLLEKANQADGKGCMFQLHHLALKLAMDMSGKAIWNHDLDSQRSYNDMVDAIVSQLSWLLVDGFMPLATLNFVRPLVHKYNDFRMERYISRLQRETRSGDKEDSCVISRAVFRLSSAQVSDTKTASNGDPYRQLGGRQHFDRVIKNQMRFLLLAGYDTTGAAITYVLHMLSKHPKVLARVREEHRHILGPNVSSAAQQLREDPHLVNCVPYTIAVIKETLRMYPPTSTIRNGKRGVYLVDNEGPAGSVTLLPTEGCMVFGNHHGLHHNPRYWVNPEEFRPERFLVASTENSALHPVKDAWRPVSLDPLSLMFPS